MRSKMGLLWGTALLTAAGIAAVAQAQNAPSPFARKGAPAWETAPQAPAPTQQPIQQPIQQPRQQTQQAQPAPAYQPYTPPAPAPQPAAQYPQQAYPQQSYRAPQPQIQAQPYQSQPQPAPLAAMPEGRVVTDAAVAGAYYPGKKSQMEIASQRKLGAQTYPAPQAQAAGGYDRSKFLTAQDYDTAKRTSNNPAPQTETYAGPQQPLQAPVRKRNETWGEKLGFGNFKVDLSGFLYAGVGAVDRSDTDLDAEAVVDGRVILDVGTITSGGLEYGINLEARAQRDRFRRGFGGRVGDCSPFDPACSSVTVDGTPRAIAGHTSQFYTFGPNRSDDAKFALEGAHLYLRSAYGDVTIGRDDGAAALFSLGAPSLVRVGASNSPVDYTGLDSVKTINDASGFSEKITYTTPRILGDQIGFGVQAGLSFAPNARACGVDYCVKSNTDDPNQPFTPDLENIIEAGLSIDRKFSNGLGFELTGTYATGSEQSGLPGFDNLKSYGAGLNFTYADWALGTSYLKSNNGLLDGDYTAYDAGLTWQPSALGFTLGYGYADDDNANLTSHQGLAAVSYDFGEFRLSGGGQYISRDVPLLTPLGRTSEKQNGYGIFIGGEIKF